MPPNVRHYYLFQHDDRVLAVKASNWSTGFEPHYVLKTDLERSFGTLFPLHATRFKRNGVSLRYKRGVDLETLLPERLVCEHGYVVEISENDSGRFSSDFDDSNQTHSAVSPGHADSGSPLSEPMYGPPPRDVRVPHGPVETPNLCTQADSMQLAGDAFRRFKPETRRLALVYDKAEAILSKRVEVYESPLPLLFVVLPDADVDPNNVPDLQQLRFKIYFLCLHGQDTTDSPTHVDCHSHAGYSIRRPKEFFEKYGPYLLVILETIRLGMGVGGHHFEPLDKPEHYELLQQIEIMLAYIERIRDAAAIPDPLNHQAEFRALREYLVNAEKTDLSGVTDYLRSSKRNNFGGLLRIQEQNGNAKWVCNKHHRLLSHPSKDAIPALSALATANGGVFKQERGILRAVLKSSTSANSLYTAVIAALPDVQEVDLVLDWNTDYRDLIKLSEMITASRISAITLNLKKYSGPGFESTYVARYTPIFDIMGHPSVRSVCFREIKGLWERFVYSKEEMDFSHLRMLNVEWPAWTDKSRFEAFLERAKHLDKIDITLQRWSWSEIMAMLKTVIVIKSKTVSTGDDSKVDIGSAVGKKKRLTEFSFQSIEFPVSSLRMTIPAKSNLIGDNNNNSNQLLMTDFIRCYGKNFSHVGFNLKPDLLSALEEVTAKDSNLTSLRRGFENIEEADRELLLKIIAKSRLTRFGGFEMSNETTIAVLGAIQWDHLSTLWLDFTNLDPIPALEKFLDCICFPTTEGNENRLVTRRERKPMIGLRRMAFLFGEPITTLTGTVLRQILESFPLEEFALNAEADLEIWTSIVEKINYSKLERIHFTRHKLVDSQCQEILNFIPTTAQLTKLTLQNFGVPSEREVVRMKAREITLKQQLWTITTTRFLNEQQ